MLAHKAAHEGKVAVQAIAGEPAAWDVRAIPAVVFTDPEIAWCGLTETEARQQGRLVKVATISALTGAAGEFEVAVDEPARVLELLRAQGWGRDARLEDGLLLTGSPTGRGRDLVRFLAAAGVWPDRVVERQRDLEDIFLDLTHASEAS